MTAGWVCYITHKHSYVTSKPTAVGFTLRRLETLLHQSKLCMPLSKYGVCLSSAYCLRGGGGAILTEERVAVDDADLGTTGRSYNYSSELLWSRVVRAVAVRPNAARVFHQCVGLFAKNLVLIITQWSKTLVGSWPEWPERFPRPWWLNGGVQLTPKRPEAICYFSGTWLVHNYLACIATQILKFEGETRRFCDRLPPRYIIPLRHPSTSACNTPEIPGQGRL